MIQHIRTRRVRFVKFAIVGTTLAIVAPRGTAGLVDQPHDFVSGSLSHSSSFTSARTADDFFSPGDPLGSITVWMIVTHPFQPESYLVDFMADDNGAPGDVVWSRSSSSIADLGEWNGNPDRHLLQIDFEVPMRLWFGHPPARWWVSPHGVGGGSARAWWGTSGNGTVNGSEGMFISGDQDIFDWTPVSDPDVLGFQSDFAMRITPFPAPGAIGAFVIAAGFTRRRRRRV